ncbi:hypothetical protein [Paraburkholderia sp. UCT31]|uniref:hypothetical protein n=1 Tax=Paraburkholderia sp. UCT31 TaxID=2615209 RepID=UPI0016560E0D|nr:hypothetical protein [Paraburkholderia sp. UCT31]
MRQVSFVVCARFVVPLLAVSTSTLPISVFLGWWLAAHPAFSFAVHPSPASRALEQ